MITFDALPRTVHAPVIRLTGGADSTVATLEFGPTVSNLAAVQLASQRWSVVLELTPGRNEFVFQPYSISATPLAQQRLVVYYEEATVELHHPPSSLDGHAARLGFSRLPTERGVSFRKRLLQGASASGRGRETAPIALATELGFPFSQDMVRVRVVRTDYNHPAATVAWVRVTPTELLFTCRELQVASTVVKFNAGYPYESLIPSPFHPITLTRVNGEPLPDSAWSFMPDTNRVWLRDETLVDQDLLLQWTEILSYPLTGDLAALKAAVEADGFVEFLVTDTDYHDDTTDADWLLSRAWQPVAVEEDWPTGITLDQPGPRFSVSEVQSFVLHEEADEFLVAGSGLGTLLEKWVAEINGVDRRTWKTIVVGRDGLRDASSQPIQSAFPHLMDASRGGWGTDQLNQHEEAYLRTGTPFIGVTSWWSGTGQLGDLEPGVVTQEMQTLADLVEESKIPTNIIYGSLS